MPDERPPDAREMGINLTLAQVGVEMVVPMIVGLVIDYLAGCLPWATLAGLGLGAVGGIAHLVMLSNQQDALQREKKKGEREGQP